MLFSIIVVPSVLWLLMDCVVVLFWVVLGRCLGGCLVVCCYALWYFGLSCWCLLFGYASLVATCYLLCVAMLACLLFISLLAVLFCRLVCLCIVLI